jgi:hypothetical protein
VEEPPLSAVTFNTSQIRKRGRLSQADPFKPRALLTQDAEDDLALELYYNHKPPLGSNPHRTLKREFSRDPILDYITNQRERLGLETIATKYPDVSEASSYREALVAASAPVAGIKDLQLLSKKLASAKRVQQRDKCAAIANEFVYALRKDAAGDCNPYDMRIVSSERARAHGSYYTVSAFNVAEVCKALAILQSLK